MAQVSIVIPAYNASRFVREAIDSVFNQSFCDYEVIVVDDGSTDGTPAVLSSYGQRIQCIRQSNQGLSAARNAGIAASSGEFIAFLDADDCWEPDKLALQVAMFQSNPVLALVHAQTSVWMPQDGTLRAFAKDSERFVGNCYDLLMDHNSICVSSVMVRRCVLEEVGVFDADIVRPTTQDYDLWQRIARLYPFGFVEQPLVRYRSHGENASTNVDIMDEDEIFVLLKRLSGDISLSKPQAALVQEKIARLQFDLGYRSFLRGEYGAARRWLWKSWRHSKRRGRIAVLIASTLLPPRCSQSLKRLLGRGNVPFGA